MWSVEAWRGVAALLVVWAHWAEPLGIQGGWGWFAFTGVDVFFVISGFVFAPHWLGHKAMPLQAYALRRILRIYPAYLAALAVYVGLAWHSGRPLLYVPEHLLMTHLQSREMAFYYNPPFWSLPSEVEFYVLLPLAAWLTGYHRAVFWPAFFGAAVAMRLLLLAPADGVTQNWAYLALHHLPGLLVEFLLGVWAWQKLQAGPPANRWRWVAGGLAICASAAWLYGWIQGLPGRANWFNGQLGLWVAAGFACVLAGSASWKPHSAWLTHTGLWAGKLSYGTYLLHSAWLAPMLAVRTQLAAHWGLPAESVVATAAALALGSLGMLASALALNRWIEEPARRWGRRWPGQAAA